MQQEYKYFAFISYNYQDTKWGKRIQRNLEGYRMPATLCCQYGWSRHPIRPVFFAPTDIQPGGLTAELQERLRKSKNLIVICSPHSAQSKWVGQEIEFFHKLGRTNSIHFFIIDGIPNSGNIETECFNSIVQELGLPEILGVNIHEKVYHWPWLNRERAYVQLITKLLGVEFDSIWKRHRRLLYQKLFAWIFGMAFIVVSIIGVWVYNMPIDVSISIKEDIVNKNLPPLHNAIVTMYVGNERKNDTIKDAKSILCFHNIPHRFLGGKTKIRIECVNFYHLDTCVILAKNIKLPLKRNEAIYGSVRFGVWNPITERMMPNLDIIVNGIKTKTNSNGIVLLNIPIEQQKTTYKVSSNISLENNFINMPCGKYDVISMKSYE